MLLDERRWDEWIALYAPDCEYWVPTWRDEENLTSDPQAELSHIYYANRAGLEDRVPHLDRVRGREVQLVGELADEADPERERQHAGDAHYFEISATSVLTNHITGKSPNNWDAFTPIAMLCDEFIGIGIRLKRAEAAAQGEAEVVRFADQAGHNISNGAAVGLFFMGDFGVGRLCREREHGQQWRPLLATALFVAALALSAWPRAWRRALLLLWLPVLAGCGWLLAGGSTDHMLSLCVAGSLLYVGGMYLNDACDVWFDTRYRR